MSQQGNLRFLVSKGRRGAVTPCVRGEEWAHVNHCPPCSTLPREEEVFTIHGQTKLGGQGKEKLIQTFTAQHLSQPRALFGILREGRGMWRENPRVCSGTGSTAISAGIQV